MTEQELRAHTLEIASRMRKREVSNFYNEYMRPLNTDEMIKEAEKLYKFLKG